MIVERIELFHAAMPLLHPWRTASHTAFAIHSVFVRMESGGVSGWGETTPLSDPTFSPEWASTAFATIEHWLGPPLLGQDVTSGEDLQARLAHVKGNPFAKAGLDLAWWDLQGKLTGRPVHDLLGGAAEQIEIGADFGVQDTLDELVALIGGALDDGFRRVKLKFRPGWDVNMLEAVRSTFPDLACHIDCNSGYTLDDLDLFRAVDRFGLVMIEQPLAYDDVVDHAKLAQALETPLCLDETIISAERARAAIELGSCRWINLKHGRCGGLTTARRIHDVCRDAGIRCWVGSMLESAVGSAFSVALATLDNLHYPADVFPTDRHYAEDLSAPEVGFRTDPAGGRFALVSPAPGIAPAPDPERLRAATLQHAVLTSP
jgi:O-succinylbenzoate synthase